jgi:hypothetical protein
LTTPESLPGLLLQAADIGAMMSSDGIVVTRDSSKAWSDTARLSDTNCLPIAGAAQQAVYAHSGSTAVHSQILREPPAAPGWEHYVVQAVALFPDTMSAANFYATSRAQWDRCSNRQMTYPQPIGPNQVWTIGPVDSDHDMLSVSRTEQSPDKWTCQRALTVRNNVAIDIEACSLAGSTTAASTIARQISSRLPAA